MESAASLSVRISFEASFEACFAAASGVDALVVVPLPGVTRGRILTASCKEIRIGASEAQANDALSRP